jgi:Zn-dependent M28 family amino/carboxypeptidase
MDLYAGSDNFSFARRGVPAVNFSPGLTGFDAEISKYYHQPADEVGTLNFSYLVKYFRSFVYASELVSNAEVLPAWKSSDPFSGVKRSSGKK